MLSLLAALALAAPVPKPGPDWVTVKGQVVWPKADKLPEAKVYQVPKVMNDAADAAKGGPFTDEVYAVDEKSRGLKNVIVWLRPDDDDPKAKFPAGSVHPDLAKAKATTHKLATEFCRFDKRVLAMRVGDKIEVTNKSPVLCLFRLTGGGDDCNQVLKPNDKPFVTPELTAGVGWFDDPVHRWISKEERIFDGRIRVFDHPYFAVTDDKGGWAIPNAPRGKWRVMYQHETGYHKGKDGRLGFPVDVKCGEKGEMTLDVVEFVGPK